MRSVSNKSIPHSGFLSDTVMVFSIFITPIAIMISSTMFMGLRYSQSRFAVRLLFRRQHSGLVSVIMIFDRVLRATNSWQSLLIWWTIDSASLAK